MKLYWKSLLILSVLFAWNCNTTEKSTVERPHDPWVFRSVMDGKPRMLTVALHDDLWASYSTETASLYKVWKGGVNFDGAVYTTAHGPQPSTLGDAYFENKYESAAWKVMKEGAEVLTDIQFKGHRFEQGKVSLRYELILEDGSKIEVIERPEYQEKESGQVGFERKFEVRNAPAGTEVVLKTNVSSIAVKENIKTDGAFEVKNTEKREAKNLTAIDVDGELTLNNNGNTAFTTFFVKKPLIENANKIQGSEEEEELPLGFRLIARNDCKTCHNTYVKTIGPAYVDVAKKYRNTEENVMMLTAKVINGGSGVWGEQVMNAHPNIPETDIRSMVEYIMILDEKEEAEQIAAENAPMPEDVDLIAATELEIELGIGTMATVYVYEDGKVLNKVADIDTSIEPLFRGILPNINIQDADFSRVGLKENFAIIFEGYINVPKDNNYLFRLASDDGSILTIDGNEIINHDGLHGAEARDGELALSKGYHPFKLEFFQQGGGRSILLEWRSFSDGEFQAMPATAFAYEAKEELGSLSLAADRIIPGDKAPLTEVHPSFDLCQARPEGFTPKVGGMDFLSDGRLVISTWDAEGGVYIVDGVNSCDPSAITTKKIASGLAEPLGLKVVDDEIYVLQKQELTKLIDNDGDDIIDEYETIANDWVVSNNFHEFAFGLVYKEGYFYATLAIAILPGGASANPQVESRGKVIKIGKDDGSVEYFAHGLRTPNGIGIGADNEIFVADNQGDWLPSSKIMHITEGDFFGSRAVDFEGTANLEMKSPVVWLPQDEIGNSPTTPSYLNEGIYKGQMIHGEVTHGGLKRVFVEKVEGEYQGAVFRFVQGLEAGVNRVVWGPDGALYIGGVGSSGNWQQNGKYWYGLQRLKFNEQSTFEMLAVRAKANGVEIEFTEPLGSRFGWDASDYEVKQWKYVPTENYGGPKVDLSELNVRSVNRSKDGKKVFLELDGMKAGHVVYIDLPSDWISETGQEIWTTEAWYTMNRIPTEKGNIEAAAKPNLADNTLTDAEKAAGWKLLFDGKTTDGWHKFKEEGIGKSWQVQDGALHFNPSVKDGGDIVTDGEYDNFEFSIEWKIQNCGNSGIMYYVVEDEKYDAVWLTGPEIQVLDNTCHPDAKIVTHRAGDLYDLIETKYPTVLPAGQWNRARIVANNGKVEHWLNGRKVVETEFWTDEWREMIANSKFKDMPDFGTAKKGHISLQDHSDKVWFKNIKIRELKTEG
ncbi:MAG: family 16 glycoside hydrolase [Bacteroidota bacterium]